MLHFLIECAAHAFTFAIDTPGAGEFRITFVTGIKEDTDISLLSSRLIFFVRGFGQASSLKVQKRISFCACVMR
jgi:hypothetical protein